MMLTVVMPVGLLFSLPTSVGLSSSTISSMDLHRRSPSTHPLSLPRSLLPLSLAYAFRPCASLVPPRHLPSPALPTTFFASLSLLKMLLRLTMRLSNFAPSPLPRRLMLSLVKFPRIWTLPSTMELSHLLLSLPSLIFLPPTLHLPALPLPHPTTLLIQWWFLITLPMEIR